MKLIRLILRRPASVLLLVAAIVVFGLTSITSMWLEYMPDMDMPMELVMIQWGGADADSIERLVTEPVEDACETLTDINTVASTTYDNYTMIQLTYNYGVDLDEAYTELKSAMDNLKTELPEGCGDATIMEISMSEQATLSVAATASEGVDVQAYLEDTVVPVIESISGVAQVELSGAQEEYLRIVVDEAALEQYGLSISSVGSAIASADFDMPLGAVSLGSQDIALSAAGSIDVATQNLVDIPIQTSAGQIIRLSDVTTFSNLYRQEADSISRYNGRESVLLDVTKQNSASTVTLCNAVIDTLEQYSTEDYQFEVVNSEADSIMDTLLEILKTLIIGVILTMLILFLFFGDIRASMIVGISMPLSLLIAVILLNAAGFAIDLMSGTALIISIGMIVDNAIVILESCMRIRQQGLDFKEAAVQGASQMLLSIFAGTLTTVVVYVPLAMADGMAGQMAGPLSWTIALSLLASFLCAVAVIPLAFTLLRPTPREELPVNRILEKIRGFYRRVMPGLLRHPGRVLVTALLLLVGALALAAQLEFVLFPSNYDGSIQAEVSFRSGTKLAVMDESVSTLEQALLADENFENVTFDLSGSTASFTAYAEDGCKRTSEQAVEAYAEQFADVAGMDILFTPLSISGGLGSLMDSGNTADVTLVADSLSALEEGADMVEQVMLQAPGVISIENEFAQTRAQGRLVIDGQRALSAGMTQATAAVNVSYLLNGLTATTIDYGDKEYDVILEYPAGKYDDLTTLLDRQIIAPSGRRVTVGDIASIEYTTTLSSISRQDGQFITTVSAVTTAAGSSAANEAITAGVDALTLPNGVSEGRSAADKMSEDEIGNMSSTLLLALFLVFLVMAVQFDSPRLSIMVMLCIPFSLIGSFGMVFIAGAPLSMLGMMGFLMLFGISVNNGIYLVDGANQLRQTMPLGEALIQSGLTRLRPILMTSLTTVISMIPMLFSADSGMGMMKEMAYIIIGGLVASTLLAMFLMPPFYLLIRGENVDGTRRRPRGRMGRHEKRTAASDTDTHTDQTEA